MALAAVVRRIPNPLAWDSLPRTAQAYVAAITVLGAAVFVVSLPHTYPDPLLLASLLLIALISGASRAASSSKTILILMDRSESVRKPAMRQLYISSFKTVAAAIAPVAHTALGRLPIGQTLA